MACCNPGCFACNSAIVRVVMKLPISALSKGASASSRQSTVTRADGQCLRNDCSRAMPAAA